jgi:hypothetical protein
MQTGVRSLYLDKNMKERPILFSSAMVQAILDGSKTMTRRVVVPNSKTQAEWLTPNILNAVKRFSASADGWWTMAVGEYQEIEHCGHKMDGAHIGSVRCPFGKIGDRLWVREKFAPRTDVDPIAAPAKARHYCLYEGTGDPYDDMNWHDFGGKWKPSIFMPRWASRITLEITDVRVERIQDISDDDCFAEGIDETEEYNRAEHYASGGSPLEGGSPEKCAFIGLWDKLNAKRGFGWNVNPWVWVIEFKKLEK